MTHPQLHARNFDAEVDGKPTCLITLHNSRGMSVSFTNLGGKILQIVVPDRNGRMDDVALGYDNIQGVIGGQASMGAFVGRFANRIAKGRFTLDGVEYAVEPNNNGNSLHGGPKGSRYRVFDAVQRDAATADLTMYYESKVDGFPGNLMSRVVYQVTEQNELLIRYDAVTDSPTVVNMTSHVFFNLAGHSNTNAQSLARHELMINAETFTPVGKRPDSHRRDTRRGGNAHGLPAAACDRRACGGCGAVFRAACRIRPQLGDRQAARSAGAGCTAARTGVRPNHGSAQYRAGPGLLRRQQPRGHRAARRRQGRPSL